MRRGQVIIFVAILVGLVASIVGSLVAGVEGCTSPTDECVRAMVARLRAGAWLGIETERLDGGAVTVTAVAPRSPAQAAGIAVGDVLLSLGAADLEGADGEELEAALAGMHHGSEVTCTLVRAGSVANVRLRLVAPPEGEVARRVGEHVIAEHAGVALSTR